MHRSGARATNATTRLTTQLPLEFGGKTIGAGEYNVFVEQGKRVDARAPDTTG
jgi:hypothetical protein